MGEFFRLVAATILGALISFGTTFDFERRKEHREQSILNAEHSRRLRQAARLVWDELVNASVLLDAAQSNGKWWTDPPYDLNQEMWAAHGPTLAELVEDQNLWAHLHVAQFEIFSLNVRLEMGRSGKVTVNEMTEEQRNPLIDGTLNDAWKDDLMRVSTVVEIAVEALRPLGSPKFESRFPRLESE